MALADRIRERHDWFEKPTRMLQKAKTRLLTRAAHNRDRVFAGAYRAATVRESVADGLFQQPASEAHYVLWWVPEGHIPSLEEARERLEHYRTNGASAHAFWFGKLFPAPAVSAAPV
jgi:hypothetical protein